MGLHVSFPTDKHKETVINGKRQFIATEKTDKLRKHTEYMQKEQTAVLAKVK